MYIDWSFLIVIITAAASVGAVINHAREIVTAAKKPKNEIISRIDSLERKVDALVLKTNEQNEENERRFKRDLERINKTESEARMNLKGILTLITSAIDGNHIDELKERREEIQQYLINKS